MPQEKFVTTVKIAMPNSGEPDHVQQTKAQNLASSAHDLKTGFTALVNALQTEKPDNAPALKKLFDALGASQKDKKVYDRAIEKARAEYDAVEEERAIYDRKIQKMLLESATILHESNCITDMPDEKTGDNIAAGAGEDVIEKAE